MTLTRTKTNSRTKSSTNNRLGQQRRPNCLWLVGLFVCCTNIVSVSRDLPRAQAGRFFYQETNALAPPQANQIQHALSSIADHMPHQIAVAVLSDIQGEAIDAFTFRLARAWGVGHKDKDNGVLMVIALREKRLFIATGNKIEGLLPDILTKKIIENTIKPALSAGDLFTGIAKGIIAMEKALGADGFSSVRARAFHQDFLSHPQRYFGASAVLVAPKPQTQLPAWASVLIGVVCFAVLLWVLSRVNRNNHRNHNGGNPSADILNALLVGSLLLGGRGTGGGMGTPQSFGGGNFGGGGAGGSW